MPNRLALLGALALFSCFPLTGQAADLLVNFSPDATGVPVLVSTYTNSVGQTQIIGDKFTLLQDVTLTGGSIFSDVTQGTTLGISVRFLIYSDPTAAPIIDITTVTDQVNNIGTTSQAGLSRKHATIADTFLAAGTYWFAMPGAANDNFTIATGNYGDNSRRQSTYPFSPVLAIAVTGGDAFFQLEGIVAVPEPSTYALLALGLGAVAARGFARRLKRR